ncbi:MAG: hypothetical protein ACYC26_13040 [Phycisphaerales bacterium]
MRKVKTKRITTAALCLGLISMIWLGTASTRAEEPPPGIIVTPKEGQVYRDGSVTSGPDATVPRFISIADGTVMITSLTIIPPDGWHFIPFPGTLAYADVDWPGLDDLEPELSGFDGHEIYSWLNPQTHQWEEGFRVIAFFDDTALPDAGQFPLQAEGNMVPPPGGTEPKTWYWAIKAEKYTVSIEEVNYIDGVDANGAAMDNNFDIWNSTQLLVPISESEITPSRNTPTTYIKNLRIQAQIKLKVSPVKAGFTTGVNIPVTIYSDGELDFYPTTNGDKIVNLMFNDDGYVTHVFTTKSKNVSDKLDYKEYVATWHGHATGQQTTHKIYTLYDTPCDNWNGDGQPNEPEYQHLQYLLGGGDVPNGDTGCWVNQRSDLKTLGNTSEILSKVVDGPMIRRRVV